MNKYIRMHIIANPSIRDDDADSEANLKRGFVASREVMALCTMDPSEKSDNWEERVVAVPSNKSLADPNIDSVTVDPSVDDKASATACAVSLVDSVAGD
ncbi:hypothetical protein ACHAXS_002180, partial [Conticribra weissflogii]